MAASASASASTSTSTATPPPLTTNTTAIPVRRIALSETKPAALTLAHAFSTDAVARYFIDTPSTTHLPPTRKWTQHRRILECMTAAHVLRGAVVTAGPAYACVALWCPPGAHTDGAVTALRSGLWRLRYQLSGEGWTRLFSEFLPLLHETKVGVLGREGDAQAWYLVYIGTRPEARGRGYARACVEWGLRAADREGRAVYLESSHVRNVGLYRRMGFEVVKRIELRGVVCAGKGGGDARLVGEEADEGGEGVDGKVVALDIMVREPVLAQRNEVVEKIESTRTIEPAAEVTATTMTTVMQGDVNRTKIQATTTVLRTDGA